MGWTDTGFTMSIIASIVIGLVWILGAGLLWIAVRRSPEGYEDEAGFHTGNEDWMSDGLHFSSGPPREGVDQA